MQINMKTTFNITLIAGFIGALADNESLLGLAVIVLAILAVLKLVNFIVSKMVEYTESVENKKSFEELVNSLEEFGEVINVHVEKSKDIPVKSKSVANKIKITKTK